MNRKLIYLLLLGWLLTPFSMRAAEAVKFFCIELRDGTKAEFALSAKPQLSFSDGNMTASTAGKSITAALADVVRYTFSVESTTTGLSTPTEQRAGKPQTDFSEGHIRLSGLSAGAAVRVVTIDGREVFKGRSSADGRLDIDLSASPSGIYVLCTPAGNLKVAVNNR